MKLSFMPADAGALAMQLSPLASLLLFALAAMVVATVRRGRAFRAEPHVAVAGLCATIAVSWLAWPEASAFAGGPLTIDRLSLAAIMIICASALASSLISQPYLAAHGDRRPGFHAMTMLAVFGMAALSCAGDLIAMLIAMESMSIALYALSSYLRDRPQSVEGALKFFLMNSFATAFYCMGLAFIFGSLGSTALPTIAERFSYVLSGEGRSVFLFGLAMVFSGLALKVAAVPFHSWAPDTIDGSPTPVSLLISTSAKAAALVAFLRLAGAIASPGGRLWHDLTAVIAAATMLWGALSALRQESIKRMLCHLSIAGGGFALAALPSLAISPAPMARAMLINLIAYCFSMIGAFGALVALGLAPGEPLDIRQLCGLGRRRPFAAAALSLFLMSLAAVPPTIGFAGRFYLISVVAAAGDWVLASVAALASALTFAACARPVAAMYFREAGALAAQKGRSEGVPGSSLIAGVMLAAALAVAVFGIFPQDLLAFVFASIPL